MTKRLGRVVVVGTGLLGGSVGLALRAGKLADRVVGVGRSHKTLDRAVSLGCVDEGLTDLAAAIDGAELVVLATPLGTFESLFQQIARADHDGLVITDVGSTKLQVCEQAQQVLPAPERFVGSHPMAGGDRHGPEHAQANLFHGKPCVITTAQGTSSTAVQTVEWLWTTLGMRLIHLTPHEHDRMVATVSHLPHLLASLTVNASGEIGGLEVASTGFRDVTRLARSDPRVWLDIFMSNREPVINAVNALVQQLNTFVDALARDDAQAILGTLEEAKSIREGWPGPGGDTERKP